MATLKSKIGSVLIPRLPVNRRTFDVLRYELQALTTRFANKVVPSRVAKIRELQRARDLSINIGSGGRGLDGWVNIELRYSPGITVCLDIRRPLPFADGSAARVLAEHVIEHMEFREDVPRLLREIYRVLQPGGVVRIIVPDAERFLEAYVSRDDARWKQLGWDVANWPGDIYTKMHAINHIFHQGGEHFFAYDFETMQWVLQRAGFRTVIKQSFRVSADPKLAIDQEYHAPYSLYVEAVK